MKRDTAQLNNRIFDLLVIGGGITGSCLAHDAAQRGWKVALVDQGDFGSFTSYASSKLLHGGIRYLPKGHLHKVRESATERAHFQNIAPHLTRYVPFLIPTFHGGFMKTRFAMMMGMAMYETLCSGLNRRILDPAKHVPSSRFMSRAEVIQQVPELSGLEGLTGAYVLPESHMINSERMTLAFVQTAARNGAVVANYVRAQRFLTHNQAVTGVMAKDLLTGDSFDIRARMTANAAGPLIPALNEQIPGLRLKKQPSGFAKGVHLVTRAIHSEFAITLTTRKKIEGLISRGGRHVFIIPWRGHSLIGTTNTSFQGDMNQVLPTRSDMLDFVDEINQCLPSAGLKPEDIRFSWAGLYPLTASEIKTDTYQGTGEYQVVDHGRENGVSGIVSVLGAKYTTGRKVAEKAADLIESILETPKSPCRTCQVPLVGGDIPDWEAFQDSWRNRALVGFSRDILENLMVLYGNEMEKVLATAAFNPFWRQQLAPDRPTIAAEIRFAVEEEMAVHLEDVVFRRTGIGTVGYPGENALDTAAEIMSGLLGWSTTQKTEELNRTHQSFPRIP
jgi:glycerol-3-phosphate dehydrogenase